MNPIKIGLFDTSFRHNPRNTVPGNDTEFIDWNRSNPTSESLVCFTNEQILSDSVSLVPKSKRIALLYESRDTMSWLYRSCESKIPNFRYFFTHEKSFLQKYNNARWIPGNGIWIGNSYGGGVRSIAQKDRMMSFVTSNKETTSLQKLRVDLAKELGQSSQFDIDVYLRPSYAFEYIPISQCLTRYRFSLIIENTISPWYFTEKLLNCFAVGTIPIYLGASEIHNFFNPQGIIKFLNKKDFLYQVIPALSERLYNSHMEAIEDNFNRSQKFQSIEKVVWENLKSELTI